MKLDKFNGNWGTGCVNLNWVLKQILKLQD